MARGGRVRPRALFLRHHQEDDPGLVGAALERRGFDVALLDVDDETGHVDVEDVAVLAILGSKWSVYDDAQVGGWLEAELAAVREADARRVAVLGICFGAQVLSVALGGGVEPAPREEIGWVDLAGVPAEGVPEGPWFQFHEDQCLPPKTARVLARNEVCVQAYRAGPHLGVQFHPELDAAQLKRWLVAGADEAARRHGVDPDALLQETEALGVSAAERVDRLVAGFLERAG